MLLCTEKNIHALDSSTQPRIRATEPWGTRGERFETLSQNWHFLVRWYVPGTLEVKTKRHSTSNPECGLCCGQKKC